MYYVETLIEKRGAAKWWDSRANGAFITRCKEIM